MKIILRVFGRAHTAERTEIPLGPAKHIVDFEKEQSNFVALASKGLAPKLYGSLSNGRIEEFWEGSTLEFSEMTDAKTIEGVMRCLVRLHRQGPTQQQSDAFASLEKLMLRWLAMSTRRCEILKEGSAVCRELATAPWAQYVRLLLERLRAQVQYTRPVFAHMDLNCGNIVRLDSRAAVGHDGGTGSNSKDTHRLLDFEFSMTACAALDLANYACEIAIDNEACGKVCHDIDKIVPVVTRAYVRALGKHASSCCSDTCSSSLDTFSHCSSSSNTGECHYDATVLQRDVQLCVPASHLLWALWSLLHCRGDESGHSQTWCYAKYAKTRLDLFRSAMFIE
ncbi:MAG: hypothetical protein MHM6MM_005033 [Cercozoa sp. M6MM]